MAKTLHVDIVSAEQAIFSGEATMVVAPGEGGELGILPDHTPLLTRVKPGTVRLHMADGAEEIIYVSGGMMEVQPDVVTILADTSVRAHDLDEAKALEAKRLAEDAIANRTGKMEIAKAQAELAEAAAQLSAIRKLPGPQVVDVMPQPLQVVVLAAGQGKRMHSVLAKVLHPLAGRPLLAHVISTAKALDPSRLCVVIGHGAEGVRKTFEGEAVAWALQERQLGTGHAVMQALPNLEASGPILVLYGDVPLIEASTLRSLVESASRGVLALLTQELDNPRGYGRIVRDPAGRVIGIVEEKDATDAQRAIREVNTGILAAPRERLEAWLAGLGNHNAQGEYYLTDIVAAAARDAVPIEVHRPQAARECLGVNSKAELAQLERIFQMNQATKLLEAGVTLADPARIDVRGDLSCGRDVAIDVNCIFEGRVTLGDGVRIGASCILRDVTVGPGTEIRPFTLVEEADIGAQARIGPYARIRPGTRLEDEVHIGNFVEVKASTLGRGSKANHLAYVGDSTVGRDVNIGAGTITCNYDGAHKHRTIIEDNVHIGSDVQLVAPVTVGKGATVGAGATIVKDVPPGGLTLTEAKQITRPNWERPRKK